MTSDVKARKWFRYGIEVLLAIFVAKAGWTHWSTFRDNSRAQGKSFTPVTVVDAAGHSQSLPTPGSNGPSVMVFWATWCGPCTVELRRINDDWADLKNTSLYLIAIDEDPRAIQSASREREYQFPVYWDKSYTGFQKLPVQATPAVVYLDKDGRITDIDTGANPFLMKKLKEHLKGQKS